jgi:hypothetical protein
MSAFVKRARLQLNRLDDRTVPSTVTATPTARPFDFTATGTLTTTTIDTSGAAPLTTNETTAVTLNGELDYTDNANGSAGLVSFSGSGTGNQPGGRGGFAETTQGQLALADADGAITTPTPITANVNWMTPSNSTGIDLFGPQNATGTFDTTNFQLNTSWTNADGSTGTLAATLAPKTSSPTDLSISNESITTEDDGTTTLDFTVNATGNLMNAASHDAAVTTVTAMWEGNGQSQATDLSVPIDWNTGAIVVHDTGLTAPSWATSLVVQVDAGNLVAEADETNNSWSATLPVAPPPPVAPPAPPPTVASFAVVPGSGAGAEKQIQWLAANGAVLAQTPAIPGFTGDVAIASGDINGDGVPDLAVAAGPGGGPRVRVLDGKTGAVLTDFFAFDPSFRGGASIALGNFNGDGTMELAAGAGIGGGPQVSLFTPASGQLQSAFFAYDSSGRGGVSVAAGNLGGAGQDNIITAPGPNEGSMLQVFNGSGASVFQADLPLTDGNVGAAVGAARDPSTGATVIVVAPDDGSALLKFRSQLNASESLLVALPPDAAAPLPVDFPVSPPPPPPAPPGAVTLMGGALVPVAPPQTQEPAGMTLTGGVLTGVPLPAPKPSGLTLIDGVLQ